MFYLQPRILFSASLVSYCFCIVRTLCPVKSWSSGHFILQDAQICATLTPHIFVFFFLLQSYCPPVQEIFNTAGPGIYYSPMKNSDVRWNFEKFLINKKGKPVLRYHTRFMPADIRKDIEDLLSEREMDPFDFF